MNPAEDLLTYTVEHVLQQIASAPEKLGFYELRFYSAGGRPSRTASDRIETFYYYPSGGTLRDAEMNIIFYEPKLDLYRSFGSIMREGKTRSMSESELD